MCDSTVEIDALPGEYSLIIRLPGRFLVASATFSLLGIIKLTGILVK